MKLGSPVVGLNDSGGARIQEGVLSLAGYADIFLQEHPRLGCRARRFPPSWARAPGGAVYSPAITDFTVMVRNSSYMFVTGPDVLKTVTHEEVTKEELGGAMTHNATSGVAHFATDDDRDCLLLIRELLGYLPSNNLDDPPRAAGGDSPDREDPSLDRIVPDAPQSAVRHARRDPHRRRRRELSRSPPALREEHHRRLREARRPAGGHRGQSAGGAGRHARHRRLGEGGALRALLRRVQHPAGDVRGRSRLSSRHRAGVRRHHPARREAAVCVRGGDGAEGDGDHAQGVRRRVLRHVEQAHQNRLQLTRGRPRSLR